MAAPEPQAAPKPPRHPLVEKILAGSAAESIRLTAARGALPLPLQDLVYTQICLLQDEQPAVVEAASESLGKMTGETLAPLLRDPGCDPIVLDYFARSGRLAGDALEAAIAHPAVLDATLEAVAASAPGETLNLIVTNEVRLIRNPRLLEVLRSNAQLSPDNRRRLAELERDFIGKEEIKIRPAAPQAPAGEAPLEAAPPEGEAPPPEGEAAPPLMTEEEEKNFEEELRRTPAFQKIMKLNVAERLQLAMKGEAEERAILIRDTARIVAGAVLKSPKLSNNEITVFASMRSVTEDILRTIASKKEWTKSYTTVHALVRNPKTPPGLTVQFLPRLGTRDLRIVAGDKNIPELVRRNARNLFLARTQPSKRMKKAH
ncbi:MAG TPA: hypothetical protein VEW47_02670 [Candidatus Dormibacteraeota bacterium]|nr:hypothetical protein [Candidatus Dormibacteraeota bacterium]